jgi:AraC family transcriptional regulator of adaptative response / DNA-3-methyladenine glycosylase II
MLDFEICNKARHDRDPAFDGLFFTAVKTTGIYCRPVCPVRQPLTRNVIFFETAPAAEHAGFRPCLRCRPETAPFCPAWKGTKTTVERALKMIEQGALDNATVEQLAERLGVGPRHLCRLFNRHIGASPIQTAKTVRMRKAKRLLNKGGCSMADIARRSGFSSVRRFNAVFRELYGRSPSKVKADVTPTD